MQAEHVVLNFQPTFSQRIAGSVIILYALFAAGRQFDPGLLQFLQRRKRNIQTVCLLKDDELQSFLIKHLIQALMLLQVTGRNALVIVPPQPKQERFVRLKKSRTGSQRNHL